MQAGPKLSFSVYTAQDPAKGMQSSTADESPHLKECSQGAVYKLVAGQFKLTTHVSNRTLFLVLVLSQSRAIDLSSSLIFFKSAFVDETAHSEAFSMKRGCMGAAFTAKLS